MIEKLSTHMKIIDNSKGTIGTFPGGPVLKTLQFHCRSQSSIPDHLQFPIFVPALGGNNFLLNGFLFHIPQRESKWMASYFSPDSMV